LTGAESSLGGLVWMGAATVALLTVALQLPRRLTPSGGGALVYGGRMHVVRLLLGSRGGTL